MDTSDEYQGSKLARIVAANVRRRVKIIGQAAFASRAGISQSTVSRVVNSRQELTLGRLEMLAKGCGCQPYELLIDDEDVRQQIVERYLRMPPPAPEAAAPRQLPAGRAGKGVGERAVDEAALRSEGSQDLPPTARVERTLGREGAGRARRRRQ